MSQVHHTLNLYGPSESEPLKYSSLRVVANDFALTFIALEVRGTNVAAG